MALGINTNMSALTAQRGLMGSQNMQSTAMQRLTTGLRINSAKDDAAGLAIADRMTAQIKGLNQAVRNANDGISLTQTAEGALQESTDLLQRMREMAVQSANDTNSASDRVALQKEVGQLQQELNRIGNTTAFNGKNVLDGTFSGKFQVGANQDQTISVALGSTRATDIGSYQYKVTTGKITEAKAGTANNVKAGAIKIDGATAYTAAAGDSAKLVAQGINATSATTGVTASATTFAQFDVTGTGTVALTVKGENSTAVALSANVTSASDLSAVAKAFNDIAGQTGITATASGSKVILNSSTGSDIYLAKATGASVTNMNVTGLKADGSTASGTAIDILAGSDATVGGSVTLNSSKAYTVTDGATEVFANGTSTLSAVGSIDIKTQGGANSALSIIDSALSYIDGQRADMGAVQNRFESTISNLQNVSENLSGARSRIQDADFAAETANLSRSQVLQQAGIAMLSQANQSSQNVLSLLR